MANGPNGSSGPDFGSMFGVSPDATPHPTAPSSPPPVSAPAAPLIGNANEGQDTGLSTDFGKMFGVGDESGVASPEPGTSPAITGAAPSGAKPLPPLPTLPGVPNAPPGQQQFQKFENQQQQAQISKWVNLQKTQAPQNLGDFFNANLDPHYAPPQMTEDRKLDNFGDVLNNAGLDAHDAYQGGSALFNAAVEGGIEALPKQMGGEGKGVDLGKAGTNTLNGLDMILNDIHQRYMQPIKRGDMGALVTQIGKHPLNFAFDTGFGGLAGAKTAGKLAPKILKRAATKLGGRAGLRAMKGAMANPIFKGRIPIIQRMLDRAAVDNALKQLFVESNREYQDWLQKIVRDIDAAYKKVPKYMRKHLVAGAEYVDATTREMIDKSPTATHFLEVVDAFWNGFTPRMQAVLGLTDEQIKIARYAAPFMLRKVEEGAREFGHMSFEELQAALAADPALQEEFDAMIEQMDALGEKAYYYPLRLARDVQNFLENHANKPIGGKGIKEDTSMLQDRGKARILETEDQTLSLRNAGHETDAARLAKDGLLRAIRLLYVHETVAKLLNNPLIKHTPMEGYVRLDLERIIGKAGEETKGAQTVRKLFGEIQKDLYIPEETQRYLENLGGQWDTPFLYREGARIWKRILLGLNWARAPFDWLQGGVQYILGYAKSPKDILTGWLAVLLALNPKVTRQIPGRFWQHIPTAPVFNSDLPFWYRAATSADRLLELNFRTASKAHNFFPLAAALKQGLDEVLSSKKGIAYFKAACQINARTIRDIREILSDEKRAEEFLKESHTWFGNFNKEDTPFRKFMKSTLMFYPWLETVWGITLALPEKAPYKAALIQELNQTAIQTLQGGEMTQRMREAGAVPRTDAQGNQVLGPNGVPEVYMRGRRFSPLLQAPENAYQIATILKSDQDVDAFGLSWNPWVQLLAWAGLGIKPGTLREYSDPDRTGVGKGTISNERLKEAREGGKPLEMSDIVQRPRPRLDAMIMQNFAPVVNQNLMDLYEGPIAKMEGREPGIPSDFSAFGNHDPKRGPGGIRKPASDDIPGALRDMIFKQFEPTEPSITEKQEKSIERSELRKIKRAYILKHAMRKD